MCKKKIDFNKIFEEFLMNFVIVKKIEKLLKIQFDVYYLRKYIILITI